MKRKLYQKVASTIQAYANCVIDNNEKWQGRHQETIEKLVKLLPQGSGFDGETYFCDETGTNVLEVDYKEGFKLNSFFIYTEYHALNENGYYDGWLNILIEIKPAWEDFTIGIYIDGEDSVQDCALLEEYVSDTFYNILNSYVDVNVDNAVSLDMHDVDEALQLIVDCSRCKKLASNRLKAVLPKPLSTKVLEFLRRNKERKYNYHQIAERLNVANSRRVCTACSYLTKIGYVEKTKILNKHSLYRYNKTT